MISKRKPSAKRHPPPQPSPSRGEGVGLAKRKVGPSSRAPTKLPLAAPRMRIGLLGGSFNPPHAAHRQISLTALKRLGLDRVWWLVSPANPLKDTAELPGLEKRIAAAEKIARH